MGGWRMKEKREEEGVGLSLQYPALDHDACASRVC
jgi:hypothetical protein